MSNINVKEHRKAEYPVDDIFINRWSPRAMSGDTVLKDELMSLFEAARWAPSSFNNQSWRFLYSLKDSESWDTYFNLLLEGNQTWVKNAGALVVILSKTIFDYNGKPAKTHAFDSGAAWQNFALQGSINGLVIHGMQGFDYDKAKSELQIPDEYEVQAMAAIGKPGDPNDLPEGLREKDIPSVNIALNGLYFAYKQDNKQRKTEHRRWSFSA
jgi:nitroreductase